MTSNSASQNQLNPKQKLINSVFFVYSLISGLISVLKGKVSRILFYQRREVVKFLSEANPSHPTRSKVLVAIVHITSPEESASLEKGSTKVERLKNTIDALLTSFAHHDLTISISTLPGRNIVQYLPHYQLEHIHVQEEPACDPMYVGYRAQDELASHVDRFDWFLFIEDDIVIYDSFYLEKIENFNQHCPYPDALLFPNRYEMDGVEKNYIDITMDTEIGWNRMSSFEIQGMKFAECTNLHSGTYCLSQAQLHRWIASGRTFKNQVVMVGPLESAATFCLTDCFTLFKPHPRNLNYLEVRHYDTKYSKLLRGDSPYIISGVAA